MFFGVRLSVDGLGCIGRHLIRQRTIQNSGLYARLATIASKNPPSEDSLVEQASVGRPDKLYKELWVKCTCHEVQVLDSYEQFVKTAAGHLDIEYVRTEEPFRKIYRKTLLASRFVKKKYRTQYEFRNYYRNMLFKNLTGSTADTFLEYIERNIPEGMLFKAEKHQIAELPFEENKE